jgi:hypothetical protein
MMPETEIGYLQSWGQQGSGPSLWRLEGKLKRDGLSPENKGMTC